MTRRVGFLIALYVVGVLLSCTTGSEDLLSGERKQTLPGMVYDGRNQAIDGAEIEIDGEPTTETDVNGRFFVRLPFGRYRIDISREGYETVSTSFDYRSIGQALHVRMTSVAELLDMTAEQIERRRWDAARTLLDRAYAIDEESPEATYLEAILLYSTDRPLEAADRLQTLLDYGYDDAYVYLFLADLYELQLDDPQRALQYLHQVARRMGDEEVNARILRIESEVEETP